MKKTKRYIIFVFAAAAILLAVSLEVMNVGLPQCDALYVSEQQ